MAARHPERFSQSEAIAQHYGVGKRGGHPGEDGQRARASSTTKEPLETQPKSKDTSNRVEWPLFESPAVSRMQITGFEMLNGSVVSLEAEGVEQRVWAHS